MTGRAGMPDRTRRALAGWAEGAGCRLLVVFGSAADRAPTAPPRDVDLAVDLPNDSSADRRLTVIGELQDLCAPRPVDVVFLHRDTDPVLRFEVFRRGEPLHEARPGLFVDEVVRALALYEDALPFRRALHRTFTGERSGS